MSETLFEQLGGEVEQRFEIETFQLELDSGVRGALAALRALYGEQGLDNVPLRSTKTSRQIEVDVHAALGIAGLQVRIALDHERGLQAFENETSFIRQCGVGEVDLEVDAGVSPVDRLRTRSCDVAACVERLANPQFCQADALNLCVVCPNARVDIEP